MADKASHKPTNHKDQKRPEQASRPNPMKTESGGTADGMSSTVEQAARKVGDRMITMAQHLTGSSKQALEAPTAAVSEFLEQAGKYLQEHGIDKVARNASHLVRQYPVASVCAGVMVGFFLGASVPSKR